MADSYSDPVKFSHFAMVTQEEKLEVVRRRKKLIIGIPKENEKLESRVPLTPEAVEILVNTGHEILIESGAGNAANYSDMHYSEHGGMICKSRKDIFKADVILKVAAITTEEIDLLKGHQVVISSLHLNNQSQEFIRKLMGKKITAIAYENIKDENNIYPVVQSMSAIAGTSSILIAAEYLSNSHGGKGVMLGGITGITPTEVVIIGAGTAAEYAVRAAHGLGSAIKIFDDSVHHLQQLQTNLSMQLHTSVFHPRVLEKALKSADVVIGAIHLKESGPRFYVTEDMVKGMKKGAVIVDLSIDQGGCFETSECRTSSDPVYIKHGVIHYCVPNLPSRVARTASIALSNVLTPMVLKFGFAGGFTQHLKEDMGLRHGVYLFNGILTNPFIGRIFNIPFKDIDLLMAAF